MKACPLRPITCDSEICSAGAGAALGLRCGFLPKSGHLSRGPARKERLGFQPRLRAACSTDPRVVRPHDKSVLRPGLWGVNWAGRRMVEGA